jgi:hypothetical protein
MKYGNIKLILHGWDEKKNLLGTMRRKKSDVLLMRRAYT